MCLSPGQSPASTPNKGEDTMAPETPPSLSSTPSWLCFAHEAFQSDRRNHRVQAQSSTLLLKSRVHFTKAHPWWKTTYEDLQKPNIGTSPPRSCDSTRRGSDVINTHSVTTERHIRLTTNTGNDSNAHQFLPTLSGHDNGSPPTNRNGVAGSPKHNIHLKNIHTGYNEITQKQAKLCC